MFVCRLFHKDRPFEQIDWRPLVDGPLTIGRDPSADWQMPGSDDLLSRFHCTLSLENRKVLLRDVSTNGTYLSNGSRAPKGEPVEISLRESISLGELNIILDEDIGATCPVLAPGNHVDPPAEASVVAEDRIEKREGPAPHRDASLIEAFCRGADLDASVLSGEDPAILMERVGAIYRQTILGLAALVAERARVKSEHELERTTIGALDNNPFKWSPTRALAQNVLCGDVAGFLTGEDAVRSSFQDVAQHLAAVAQAAEAATDLIVGELAPAAIEAEARAQNSLLRSRATICWEIHKSRHAKIVSFGEGPSLISDAFVSAYLRASGTVR